VGPGVHEDDHTRPRIRTYFRVGERPRYLLGRRPGFARVASDELLTAAGPGIALANQIPSHRRSHDMLLRGHVEPLLIALGQKVGERRHGVVLVDVDDVLRGLLPRGLLLIASGHTGSSVAGDRR